MHNIYCDIILGYFFKLKLTMSVKAVNEFIHYNTCNGLTNLVHGIINIVKFVAIRGLLRMFYISGAVNLTKRVACM